MTHGNLYDLIETLHRQIEAAKAIHRTIDLHRTQDTVPLQAVVHLTRIGDQIAEALVEAEMLAHATRRRSALVI